MNNNKQNTASDIVAMVRLMRYRFPKTQHVSGTYAITVLEVTKILEGEIPSEAWCQPNAIIVTGNMPSLEYGVEYKLNASLVCDKKWGVQYNCNLIQLDYDLNKPEDQKKFLSFFMTQNQIDLLFSMYDNPGQLLKNHDLDALTKIKGIGPVIADRLCTKYLENLDNGKAYVALKELGLTKNAIDKLIVQFGSADVAVDIVKTNPYQLIKLVRGYGWEKADAIALKQGFAPDSRERCMARAQYELDRQAEDGNSCMPVQELLDLVEQTCTPVQREQVSAWIKEDIADQEQFDQWYEAHKNLDHRKINDYPTFFYSKATKRIGTFRLRLVEKDILEELKRLSEANCSKAFDKETCARIIAETEEDQGFKYTEEQQQAIWNCLNNNISIITGSAGTGKSSTVKPLINIFKHYGLSINQCALSGRAASLLTEYTGLVGKTIHRLLGFVPESEHFAHSKFDPIKSDVIILDEASMVGEELFLDLVSSIQTGARLIMLGDIKQLPPISVGNLLNDCLQSNYINTNILTVIQRQAMKSGIVSQAINVCAGKSIVKSDFFGEELRGELNDFKMVAAAEQSVVHKRIIDEFKKLVESKAINPDDVQVVVPIRSRGINSCRNLNCEIQQIVNSEEKEQVTLTVKDSGQQFEVSFRKHDKIMVIKNNYHARTVHGKEVAIFNGNMGHIIKIDEEAMIINLDEQDENIILPRDEWNNVIHSWACTCHRLQGSQAKYVVIGLDTSGYTLLSREWLYTALTRAKKYCVLVCQPKACNTATRTSNVKTKQTWLKNDLYEEFLRKQGE